MAKDKLNSLQQEILLQEQLTVSNEINRLEYDIQNGVVNIPRNNRFRFWVSFFSFLIFFIFAVYIMILMIIPDVINLNLETQKIMIFGSSIIMVLVPLFTILYLVSSSLRIKRKNAEQKRVNQIMLTRLLHYYKLLKFEFDPERYKVYDDSFVVDMDENGNLIKYVRFYNEDGSITTRPFKDTAELRKFIDEAEEQKRLKIENEALMKKVSKLENLSQNFNTFDLIDNNAVSKYIVEDSNIGSVKLVKENSDFYPDQYEDKVFKWFNKEEFRDAANFRESLRGNILHNSWDNGETVISDASWLKENTSSNKKNNSIFFKHYDLQKQLAQTSDVVSFINLIKNFDLAKDPAIDWRETIDPKDINKDKLKKYEELIKEYEDRAIALTNEQIRLETILKNDKSNVLKIQLIDNVGVDTYEKFDPYRNIRKELDKQQRRVEEIKKSKELFKQYGLEETNFEGLTIKQIKQLTNMKIKEAKKLKALSEEESIDELVKLNNEIARIKAEKFKEIHLANEKYETDDGRWEYHDGNGNYFTLNENNEWIPTKHAAEVFEEMKDIRIAKAQQKYYELQKKKVEQDKQEMENHVRELEQLQTLKEEKKHNREKSKQDRQEAKRLAKEAKEKEKQLIKESQEAERESNEDYQKQFENKTSSKYVEIHPANETFQGPDGRWTYHDGNGNYYAVDDTGNWAPIPSLVEESNPFEVIEEKEKKKMIKQQMKELKKQQNELKQQEENQQQENSYSATENTYNEQQEPTTNSSGGGQQWQDENGTWWYLDEQGNYYYSDGTNWIPWQG